MSAISVTGLQVAYGSTRVLDDVSLEVASGELFFLLGASGCGKTTLLRSIAGFVSPQQGAIRIAGAEVTGIPTEKRGIGMVFQHYALWPHLDVAGNVAFGLEVQGLPADERRRRTAEALALVELDGYDQRRIGELSGGQQQRVALARAIAVRPKVLLLDEPLSNLDPRLRGAMRETIRRVCREAGLTAIYVTHDQVEALATADRIAFLDRGRVEQVGTPRALYDQPISRRVATFVGEANLLDAAQVEALIGSRPVGALWCLRPERLRLGTGPLTGELLATSFEGPVARHRLRIHGVEVTATEPAPPLRTVGDQIALTIRPEDLVALERE